MWKQTVALCGGILVGAACIGLGIYCYKKYMASKNISNEEVSDNKFAKRIKEMQDTDKKFEDLLSSQSYVDVLTAKELTSWFRANRNDIKKGEKMIIAYPTVEILKGLGYFSNEVLDVNTNIIQLFYNDNTSEVSKIRLVNFSEIESNLQATLIEQDGMMVVTD